MSNCIDTKPFNNWDYSEHFDGTLTEDAIQGMDAVLAEIERQPVIKLVRCKDCLHYTPAKGNSDWGYCTYWSDGYEPSNETDFCSHGFVQKEQNKN